MAILAMKECGQVCPPPWPFWPSPLHGQDARATFSRSPAVGARQRRPARTVHLGAGGCTGTEPNSNLVVSRSRVAHQTYPSVRQRADLTTDGFICGPSIPHPAFSASHPIRARGSAGSRPRLESDDDKVTGPVHRMDRGKFVVRADFEMLSSFGTTRFSPRL